MEITYWQKKVKIKSNSSQNAIETTCMQTRVKIKSNSLQNTMVVTYMNTKVEIKSNSLQDTMHGGHPHAEDDKKKAFMERVGSTGSAQLCLLFLVVLVLCSGWLQW